MRIIDVASPIIDGDGNFSLWLILGMATIFVITIIVLLIIKRRGKKMKKIISVFLIGMLLLVSQNVYADAGGPVVISYDVVVSNKDGAACYKKDNSDKYVKTGKKIASGKSFTVYDEIYNGYVGIYEDNCEYISSKDIKTKKDKLDINSESVEKITPVKAVILAKGGLNLRKGPAVAYGRITTVPQYSVVTLSRRAGTYWYYADYNGKKGWISGVNNYYAIDSEYVLISHKSTPIYNPSDTSKQIGNIPALTEITDYIRFVSDFEGVGYYVNYNGLKGYIYGIPYKLDGKIKVLEDTKVYNGTKEIGNVKAGTVLDYILETYDTIEAEGDYYCIFYIPSLKGTLQFLNVEGNNNGFEYVKEGEPIKKTKGYIGEGLFGEKKTKESDKPIEEPIEEPVQDDNPKHVKNPKEKNNELIIICVLGSVILALTIVIIILLVNRKKTKKEVVIPVKNEPVIEKEKELEPKQDEKGDENEIKEQNEENTKE